MYFKVQIRALHRLSNIFQPINITHKISDSKNSNVLTSKSQKLLLDFGIVRQSSPGCFHLLPIGVRVLEKLTRIVDEEMMKIGGQKVIFPTFTSSKLWKTTGRLESANSELFKVYDRHNQQFLLSPTHEEAATDLLTSLGPLSYKHYPIRLYQITDKFRDEQRPRHGLLRGKQFLMKDLYTFDVDEETAKKSYEKVGEAYDRILKRIGVDYVKVIGSSGMMGGSISHEFHYRAPIGEDVIVTCGACGLQANAEIITDTEEKCPKCGATEQLKKEPAIEIGHTFILGEKYSKPLVLKFLAKNGHNQTVQMGSYGLGMSRIIAAAVEALSSEQEIRWPLSLAPYKVVIIPPKGGSKEESILNQNNLIHNLEKSFETIKDLPNDDILLDDRINLTIGRRFLESKSIGYPFIIVLGKKSLESPPLFELTHLDGSSNIQQLYLSQPDLLQYLSKALNKSTTTS